MNRPKAGLQHSTELGEGSWEEREREGREEKTHKYSVVETDIERESREKNLNRKNTKPLAFQVFGKQVRPQ